MGRWLSRDPIGEEVGGINLYAFADNTPIGRIDPVGLATDQDQKDCEAAGGTLCAAGCCCDDGREINPANEDCCPEFKLDNLQLSFKLMRIGSTTRTWPISGQQFRQEYLIEMWCDCWQPVDPVAWKIPEHEIIWEETVFELWGWDPEAACTCVCPYRCAKRTEVENGTCEVTAIDWLDSTVY